MPILIDNVVPEELKLARTLPRAVVLLGRWSWPGMLEKRDGAGRDVSVAVTGSV
jgi:hypothetical protein